MKAITLDHFFETHHSTFWLAIEKLIHHHPHEVRTMSTNHPTKLKHDLLDMKMFESEAELEDYVKSFRQ